MMRKNNFSNETRKKVFERDDYTCRKCGFKDRDGNEIEIYQIAPEFNIGEIKLGNLVTLCHICHNYSPDSKEYFERYVNEKINWEILETFRKSSRSIGKRTKIGMNKLFEKGLLVVRAPLGYKIVNKDMLPTENSHIIQEIYQDFLDSNVSLTQLSKKYNLSVNGFKKVLTNETYLGKVKFAGKVSTGKHIPLISEELFNKVQEKLKK